MPGRLPQLHDGHSPIALQNAFHDALEAMEAASQRLDEEIVWVEGAPFAVMEVVAAMRGCTDLVPLRTRDVVDVLRRRMEGAPAPAKLDSYSGCAALAQGYWELKQSRPAHA